MAVVGGGIIGCALAFELAQQRKKVCILEQNELGREASWAAAGMLAAQAETKEPDSLFEWLCASREIYPHWCQQIERLSGQDPGFYNSGTITLIGATANEQRLADEILQWQSARNLQIERISAAQVAQLEPDLAFAHDGALYFPNDHHADNRLLVPALAAACEQLGVSVFAYHPVHQITPGCPVRLAAGNHIFTATQVAITTGAWTQRWQETLDCRLPVFPVKGEMVALQNFPIHSRHIIIGNGIYIIPRHRDFTLVGSTLDFGTFDKSVTAGGVAFLLARAMEMFPKACSAPLASTWAGLRPCTPDRMPIVGPIGKVRDIWVASGHYRNGILLAPLTARVLAEAMAGKPASRFLTMFSPERFQHAWKA